MLVSRSLFEGVITKLSLMTLEKENVVTLDTETYGLRPYHGDRLFSIIIGDHNIGYYFNFKEYPNTDSRFFLDQTHMTRLKFLIENSKCTWEFFNAKFDMAMLANEGIDVSGLVYCGQACSRVEYNDRFNDDFSLDRCAARIKEKKDDKPKEYCLKNGLWEWVIGPTGKKWSDRFPLCRWRDAGSGQSKWLHPRYRRHLQRD